MKAIRSIEAGDPIEAASTALSTAQAQTAAARVALAESERAKDAALENASDELVAAAVARTMKSARAVAKAEGEEATARASLEKVSRARNLANLEEEVVFVESQQTRVRPLVERVSALRLEAWQIRQEIAREAVAGQDAHDRADALAEHLRMPVEVPRRITRPTMRELVAHVQAANARDDERLDHEDASDLFIARGAPRS